jgi:tetratricopeptide (TPR) repeat protein
MRDSAHGFFGYASDGTAQSDSARRLAALGMWDLEGGDRARGLRLVRAARELSVSDSTFYLHAGLALQIMRQTEDALAVYEVATARWPELGWTWKGKAAVLEKLGRHREAEVARQRITQLPARR